MWRAVGASVYTPSRLPRNSKFLATEGSSPEKKNTTVLSKVRFAKNSNFCSNRRAVPTELTRTKMLVAVGFPVTSKSKFSILFEDRLDNHVLLCPLLVSSLSCSLCRMNRCMSSEGSFRKFIMQSF